MYGDVRAGARSRACAPDGLFSGVRGDRLRLWYFRFARELGVVSLHIFPQDMLDEACTCAMLRGRAAFERFEQRRAQAKRG